MADGTTLGKLTVELAIDASGVDRGAKQASQALNNVEKSSISLTKVLGALAAAFSIQQISQFVSQNIQAAASLSRMAEQAGISTRELQQLNFVFRDTGVSQDQLAQATATLARNLDELKSGTGTFLSFLKNTSPHLIAQFKNVKDVSGAFDELSRAISGIPNRFDQQRLATAALSEAGAKLSGELAKGVDQFKKTKESATNVISDDQIQKARDLDTKFKDLTTTLSNFAVQAAVVGASLLFNLKRTLTDVEAELRKTSSDIALLNIELATNNRLTAQQRVNMQQLISLHTARQEELIKEEDVLRRKNETQQKSNDKDREGNDLIAIAQLRLAEYLDKMAGLPVIFDQSGLAGEMFAERMVKAQNMVAAATEKSFEVAFKQSQLRLQLQRNEQNAILQTASIAAQAITTLFPKSKNAAIAAAVINTAVSITRALSEVPWPYNLVQAALHAAMGAAQIATIRSTSLSGGGSTPSVGAGAGVGAAPTAAIPVSRTLTIQGVDPAALFSGAQVEKLIQSINNEVQNGATLIATRNLPI